MTRRGGRNKTESHVRSDDFISKEGGSTGGGTCRKGGMDEEDGGRWGARERYLAGRAKHFDTSSCSASRLWHIAACVCERDEAAPTSRLIYCRSTDGPSVCVCLCAVSVKNIKKRKICTLIETQSTDICCTQHSHGGDD